MLSEMLIFDNMDVSIQHNIMAIKAACSKHGVAELYLFGSAAKAQLEQSSDIDFAVVFKEDLSPIEKGGAFFSLLDELGVIFEGRKIDLVSYKALKNPIFIAALDKSKVELYAA